MGLLSQESNYFGLDIGSTAIRLVQLKDSGSRPVLVSYGEVKVPFGLTTSDSQLDRDKIVTHIKQLVNETRTTTKNVVAGLPSANIFASVITTPKLSHAELSKAIKYQADQYIPMALTEVKLAWEVLGSGKTAEELEVLLVAAPNMTANKYLEILEKSGLEILALEANAIAAARALVPSNGAPAIILDLASMSTDLTVVYKNSPRLLRSIPIGSHTFIKAVAQGLGLDDTQAEQFTYRFGLTSSKLEGQVLKAIKPSLDNLIEEVQKSIKFFADRYAETKLEKIVLTGNGIGLPDLATYIANAAGLQVEMGNPWINISYPSKQQEQLMSVSAEYAVAVGLAERSFL